VARSTVAPNNGAGITPAPMTNADGAGQKVGGTCVVSAVGAGQKAGGT
jgi:hypothetical protein